MATRDHWLLPDAPFPSYRDYLAAKGSSAVEIARRKTPDEVLEAVKHSGLRGRGGAGFPTGTKWQSVKGNRCPTRYVVCNAAEGEPGTFKDRFLLRRNPFATIEGLAIAAHVVGAKEAFIAMKGSFKQELERVRKAIEEMSAAGVLQGLVIKVVEGPEEYLFGEEKALLNVVEGDEPLPRPADSPPYEVGLFATPTSPNPAVVNNAQTLAHVSTIVRHGPESFRNLGTHDTPGTVLFTLVGDLARPGVYEVEAGVTLRKVLHELGGGPKPSRKFKAILSGVSAPVLLPDKLDTPADFGSMALAGSSLGAAGFIVIDDATPIPRVARTVARFLYVESCNQCSACKAGLRIASRALDGMFDSEKVKGDDIDRATSGALTAPQGNRCFLPAQGSLLIPSLIRRFRSEFEAQIANPTLPGADWPLPKIVDFDEATRTFKYDERQALKQPNWTYRAPAPQAPPRPRAPSQTPEGPVAIHLAPDLARQLQDLAQAAGLDLDREVDRALRDWLRRAPPVSATPPRTPAGR